MPLLPPPHHRLICLITSRHAFLHHPEDAAAGQACLSAQLRAIGIAAQAGCQLIQIREKDLGARALLAFVRAAVRAARPYGARILVNDRLDVALAAGADGVHLRASSLPAAEARRIARLKRSDHFLIGVSTHTPEEAQQAEAGGADFIVFGPVFPPLSKRAEGPIPGLAGLAAACRAVRIPVLGLGGVQLDNFADVIRHGAAGIAAISLFTRIEDLHSTVSRLLA